MTPTTVVNLRRAPYDVYIGRVRADPYSDDVWEQRGVARVPARGCFGNPFQVDFGNVKRLPPLDAKAYLASVLAGFRAYFAKRVEEDHAFRAAVLGLRGKRLGCFCKPGPCHGDIIAAWVDAQPVEVRP